VAPTDFLPLRKKNPHRLIGFGRIWHGVSFIPFNSVEHGKVTRMIDRQFIVFS